MGAYLDLDDYLDIDITVTGGNLYIVRLPDSSFANIVLNVTGDIIIQTSVNVGQGQIEWATGGRIYREDGDEVITAAAVDLSSGSGIDIGTDTEVLTAQVTRTGNINVVEADDLEVTSAVTADGSVTITTGGGLTADTITATDDVTLNAGGAVSAQVAGDGLNVAAGGAVLLTTAVTSLDVATSAAGDISVTEADGITVSGLTAANGAVTLTAGGPTTVTSALSLTDSDDNDISLTTTNGSLIVGSVDAGSQGDVSLTSAADLTGGPVTADELEVNAGGAVSLTTDVTELDAAAGGSIAVTEADSLLLTSAVATDGSISVTAGGPFTATSVQSLTDSDDNDISLTTTVGSLTIGDVNAGVQGDATLSSAVGVTGGSVTADELTVHAGGSVFVNTTVTGLEVTADGEIEITETDDLSLTSAVSVTGSMTVTTGGDLTGGTATADGLVINAAGSVSLNTAVTELNVTAGGGIDVTETDGLVLTSAVSGDGPVSVTAGGTLTATSVESATDSDDNDISLTTTAGDVNLGTVTAGLLGDVTLTAAGAVTGGSVVADELSVNAGGLVSLYTTVSQLDATAGGAIEVVESGSLLLTSVTSGNGPITVATGGELTATLVRSSTDSDDNDISLSNGSGSLVIGSVDAGTQGDVTLTSAGNVTGGSAAADQLVINAAGSVSLNTTVTELEIAAGGGIDVSETDGLLLTSAASGDGPISVTAGGDLTATSVRSLTDDDTNDISLITISGSMTVGTVDAGSQGDVTLNSAAGVSGGMVTGDELDVEAGGSVLLNTTVSQLDISAGGGIAVAETDGLLLTNAVSGNGPITLATGGELTATLVRSNTDSDDNDISLSNGGGSLTIGTVDAGAQGDAMLTSTGDVIGGSATADVLTINAAGVVSLNTTVTEMVVVAGGQIDVSETDGLLLTGAESGDGSISVTAGGDLTATSVRSQTDSDVNDISLSTTSGSLNVGIVDAGTRGDVTLDSAGGISGGSATGDRLDVKAGSSVLLDSTVTELNVAAGGGINVTETDALLLTSAVSGNGPITVAAGGDLTATSVESLTDSDDNDISLTTTDGAVTVGQVDAGSQGDITLNGTTGVSGGPVTGDALTVRSGGAVQLDTMADVLDITAASDIVISETDLVALMAAVSDHGTIGISANGTITVAADGQGLSTQNRTLNLTATGVGAGIVINSPVSSGAGAMNLAADEDVVFGVNGDLTSGGGAIGVTAGGQLQMADGALIDAGDALIDLTANGNVTVGSAVTTGEVQITSQSGRIIDGGDAGPDIVGSQIALRAESGIGDDDDPLTALETQNGGNPLILAAVTDQGDIRVDNTGQLTVGNVDGLVGVTIMDSDDQNLGHQIVLTAASPQIINSPVVDNAGGDIVLAAQGNQVTDDLTIEANITATGGNGDIRLYAGHDILHNLGVISAAGVGDVTLGAGEDYNGGSLQAGHAMGDVTMADGRFVSSVSGDIVVRATADISLSVLMATGGDVTVSADDNSHGQADGSGRIIDIRSGEAANIIGDLATLRAATGLGATDDIQTNVTTVDASNSTSGDIQITEVAAGGDVDVNRLSQAASGNISLTTEDGSITLLATGVGASTAAGGAITLFADGGDDSDLTINAAVSVSGDAGDVVLRADNDITGSAGGTIAASGGDIEITADFDNNEAGTIQLAGDITAGAGTVTFSLADCDGRIGVTPGDADGDVTAANIVMGVDARSPEGVLRLQGGANSFSGTTTVVEGTLIINGTLTDSVSATDGVIVMDSGVLGGNGTIASDVTVESGGLLDPGDMDGTNCTLQPGRLTMNGDLLMRQNAVFRAQLEGLTAGTQYDQLQVNGQVNLTGDLTGAGGAVLAGDFRFTVPIGAEFRIIRNDDAGDRINSRFQDLTEGDFFTLDGVLLNISYASGDAESNQTALDNDVTLTRPGRFDFNASPAVLAPNSDGISSGMLKAGSNAMGWDPNAAMPFATMSGASENRPFTADEKTPLSAVRDLHATGKDQTATFLMDVVANQAYQVSILSGDFYWPHDSSTFTVRDGSNPDQNAWQTLTASTGRGQFSSLLFESLTISEIGSTGRGQIAIDMNYTGDKSGWHAVINALDIRPVLSVGEIVMSRTGGGSDPLNADGLTIDTYSGAGAPPNSLITLAATNGVLVVSDTVTDQDAYLTQVRGVANGGPAHLFRSDVQVISDGDGDFTFQLQRPSGAGDVTVWAFDASGLSLGEMVQDFSLGGPAATPTESVRRFDFGSGSSPVAADQIQVTPSDIWSDATGYGWAPGSSVSAGDRSGVGDSMLRDHNFGLTATFRIAVDEGVDYAVRVYVADNIYGHDQIYVGVEGSTAAAHPIGPLTTTPSFYPEGGGGSTLARGMVGTTSFLNARDADGNGFIEITLDGSDGWDPNFVINGIYITSGDLSGALPLQAAAAGPEEPHGDRLTASELQPILDEAVSQWIAFGLTSEQTQVFDNLDVRVADLSGTMLATADVAGGRTMLVDRDAAGHGWFIDASPWEDSEYTSDDDPPVGIDLLTVVLHELGHMLGLEDVSAEDHPDAVMALSVMPGQTRRLTDGPLLASQNADNPLDIDANGAVTPLDVLRLINHINAHGASLWNPRMGGTPVFADVTADGVASAADVLRVINYLNVEWYVQITGGISTAEAEADPRPEPNGPASGRVAVERPTVGPEASDSGSLDRLPEASACSSLDYLPEASAYGSLQSERDAAILEYADAKVGAFADEWDSLLDDIADDIQAVWQ